MSRSGLQFRTPKGAIHCPAQQLPLSSTWAELKQFVAEKTGVSSERLRILTGYPPKPISASEDATLASLKINLGDMLTVQECEPSTKPTQPAGAASAATHKQPTSSAAPSTTSTPQGSVPPPVAKLPVKPYEAPPIVSNYQLEGNIVHRIVPSDNSCLFASIGYLLHGHNRAEAPRLRKVIADAVSHDPTTYDEAFLGKPNKEYCQWILDAKSWGGAIELSVFAKHYRCEIAAMDVARVRYDVYGQGENYGQRILLFYDGLHYDPLALSFVDNGPEEMDQTIFNAQEADAALSKAMVMCKEANKKRQFTDTATFTLRCAVCQAGLAGEKEATEHAMKTGHTNFQEY